MSLCIIIFLAVWEASDLYYAATNSFLISGILGGVSVGMLAFSIEGLKK